MRNGLCERVALAHFVVFVRCVRHLLPTTAGGASHTLRSMRLPQAPWYVVSQCELDEGRIVEEDIVELCWVCGQSLDIFCGENRDDLITKYRGDIGGRRLTL